MLLRDGCGTALLRNPCILGGPQRQARGQNQNWLPHPCLLGGPQVGGIAMFTLHSRGSPKPSAETKSEMAASPLPSRGPTGGRSPLHSRGSPTKGRKSELATSSLPSRGPKRGRKCYVTLAFSGVPKSGDKIKSGYLTLDFSGAHKWAELLCYPCIVGGPQQRGQNQKWPHWGQGQNFGCAAHKNITKKRPFLKKGGVPKPPTLSDS